MANETRCDRSTEWERVWSDAVWRAMVVHDLTGLEAVGYADRWIMTDRGKLAVAVLEFKVALLHSPFARALDASASWLARLADRVIDAGGLG